MAATTTAEVIDLREEQAAKIELRLEEKSQNSEFLQWQYRVILSGLPTDGTPELMTDAHRAAIDRIIERSKVHNMWVVTITGHASRQGTTEHNQQLSEQRAQAVFDYLKAKTDEAVDGDGGVDKRLYDFRAKDRIFGRGERDPIRPITDDSTNHPLNRRVEITYTIRTVFPNADDPANLRSRQWRLDFGDAITEDNWVLEGGTGEGTLTMLPDGEGGPASEESRPIRYTWLGVSVGLAAVVKKFKFLKKFPRIEKILKKLEDLAENSAMAESIIELNQEILKELGIDTTIAGGGAFETPFPISWQEIATFNYTMIAGNLTLGGQADGAILLLHSPHFFASTVMYEVGTGFADASVRIIPGGVVTVLDGPAN